MGGDALETADGAALATEIVDMLESELVRFRHRVAHGHGIELDRARAAMVLLGKLVGNGVTWRAKPDSDPVRIYEDFTSVLPAYPDVAPSLKKEIAAFFVATTDVKTVEDTATTPTAILRRAGAEPSLWWWAADHAEPASCWTACAGDVDRSVQVALAFGTPVVAVARALAKALALLATRLKTRHPAQRTTLVATLHDLAGDALADLSAITKIAFEMRFKDPQGKDPLAELSVHAFQLVEALQATKERPDVERFGALARRIGRMFETRGLNLDGMVRADLQAAVEQALATLQQADNPRPEPPVA